MWKSPKHGDTIEVLEREPQLNMIVDYIRKLQKGEKGGKGVFSLLGTAGMTGIGKTQLLLNGLKHANEIETVKGAFFTFNGQGNLKELVQQSRGTEGQDGDAFGQALLGACKVPRDETKSCVFETCLRIIRKLMNVGDDEHIVLFVDELGHLDEDLPLGANTRVVPLLKALMRCMDVVEKKIVFVFLPPSGHYAGERGNNREWPPDYLLGACTADSSISQFGDRLWRSGQEFISCSYSALGTPAHFLTGFKQLPRNSHRCSNCTKLLFQRCCMPHV